MKFGKLLEGVKAELEMPETLFLRYKQLKKHLKAMPKRPQSKPASEDEAASAPPDASPLVEAGHLEQGEGLSPEEQRFINTLNEDLARFNAFFIEREEDSVIKLQALGDRIHGSASPAQLAALKAELVDFHGEMVLLLHWSMLNYAAVVKILKKHDKRSGLLLRAPYLANVLQQPFSSTHVMSGLVKKAEGQINELVGKQASAANASSNVPALQQQPEQQQWPEQALPQALTAFELAAAAASGAQRALLTQGRQRRQQQQQPGASGSSDSAETASTELPVDTDVFQRTRLALRTWSSLASNASTPSTVMACPQSSELVRSLQVRERWARIVGVPPGGLQPGSSAGTAAASPAVEAQGEAGEDEAAACQAPAKARHSAPQVEDASSPKRRRV